MATRRRFRFEDDASEYERRGGYWIGDNIVHAALPEKDFCAHQQALSGFRALLRRLTRPGWVICDPFMGSATTGAAAILNGQFFLGCDRKHYEASISALRLMLTREAALRRWAARQLPAPAVAA